MYGELRIPRTRYVQHMQRSCRETRNKYVDCMASLSQTIHMVVNTCHHAVDTCMPDGYMVTVSQLDMGR